MRDCVGFSQIRLYINVWRVQNEMDSYSVLTICIGGVDTKVPHLGPTVTESVATPLDNNVIGWQWLVVLRVNIYIMHNIFIVSNY